MQKLVWILVVLLLVLHQDFWFWESNTLVFGIMPIGLFFHAMISIAASITWWLATKHCWPDELPAPTNETPAANGEDA